MHIWKNLDRSFFDTSGSDQGRYIKWSIKQGLKVTNMNLLRSLTLRKETHLGANDVVSWLLSPIESYLLVPTLSLQAIYPFLKSSARCSGLWKSHLNPFMDEEEGRSLRSGMKKCFLWSFIFHSQHQSFPLLIVAAAAGKRRSKGRIQFDIGLLPDYRLLKNNGKNKKKRVE